MAQVQQSTNEDSGKACQQKIPVAVGDHKRVFAVILVMIALVAFLLLTVISLCIAFSVEIANLKSEVDSGLVDSQTQQQQQLAASNSSLLEMLSQQLLQDVAEISARTKDVNSSLEMLLRDISEVEAEIEETNSSQQLFQRISAIDDRAQELNSSLEMLSQQQLQDGQEISAVGVRMQELNTSVSEQLLQARQDASAAIDSRSQELNSSLAQQLLRDRQELDSAIQEVDSSLEMQLLQGRLNISAVDSRTREVNSSVEMLSQQLLQADSDIDRRIDNISASLSQQVNDVQIQSDQTVSRLEMLGSLETFPAPSCANIHPSLPSGYYWLRSSAERVFCDMSLTCGGITGGWARVAQQNFSSDPCPSGFSERMDSDLRTCQADSTGCTSIGYSTLGITYSIVCGRVVAYQFGSPGAFSSIIGTPSLTVDSQYLDGLSLTHGPPRQHVWSFAAGVHDASTDRFGCPCNTGSTESVVGTFIGTDYFCDTAASAITDHPEFYPDDPLWDGAGCGTQTADCCSLNTPPWFFKLLPEPTSDDIEIRACVDGMMMSEGTPIESLEFYVQ